MSAPVLAAEEVLAGNAILHSIRHYAQLATLVRQHGFKPGCSMDYLMMGFERVDES